MISARNAVGVCLFAIYFGRVFVDCLHVVRHRVQGKEVWRIDGVIRRLEEKENVTGGSIAGLLEQPVSFYLQFPIHTMPHC